MISGRSNGKGVVGAAGNDVRNPTGETARWQSRPPKETESIATGLPLSYADLSGYISTDPDTERTSGLCVASGDVASEDARDEAVLEEERPRTAEDFAMSTLSPFVPGLSEAQNIDRPQWWSGKTLAVPEEHHFEHAFDYGAFDDEAPVDKALGTLMKYYLLKGTSLFPHQSEHLRLAAFAVDLRSDGTAQDARHFAVIEYLIFALGLVTGLFVTMLVIGVCLLRK